MRIGRLSQRVTIERPVNTQGADGSYTTTWETVADIWASMMPLKGRERLIAKQTLAEEDIRIRMRRDPPVYDMDKTWRLTMDGVLYNIVGIINVDMANRELEVWCISGANNG